jgi:hypothetical protein
MEATRYCITLRGSHDVRVPHGVRVHAWQSTDFGAQLELIVDVQPGVVWSLPEKARVEILERGTSDNPPIVAPQVRIEPPPGFIGRESVLQKLRALHDCLPPPGTPAADLTEEQRLAVAILSGAPYEVRFEGFGGCDAVLRVSRPIGIADKGDGTYIVAVGPKPL